MKKLLMIVLIALSSCEPEEKRVDEVIVGSWKWERTDGGLGNHIHDTPETTGSSITWFFTSAGTYSKTNNGVEIENGIYRLKKYNSSIEGPRYGIWFSSSDALLVLQEQKEDALILSDGFADGVQLQFSRLNTHSPG